MFSKNSRSVTISAGAILAALLLSAPSAWAQASQDSGAITPPILGEQAQSGEIIQSIGGTPQPKAAAPTEQPKAQAAPAEQPAAPPSGAGTLTAYGDWSTECFAEAVGGLNCQMVQKVVSRQGGQTVLVVALANDAKTDATNIQIAVPLGVQISNGTQLMVGNEYQNSVQISRCAQQGCIIEGIVTPAFLDAMKRGSTAAVIVFNDAKRQIPLTFSLNGFTAAYAAMIEANS